MMLTTKSANCTEVIWVEAAPKKKNVKTTVTGVIVAMLRRRQKAGIIKINREAFVVSLVPKNHKK
jgi:uncharacterized membrane protein (Fun14 family)